MAKPVKEGQILDLEIKEISKVGDEVAKFNDFIIFVKGTQAEKKLK